MIHSLRLVGTTYDCRQQRIAALEDNAPVYFKLEPGNLYDPLAIAVVSESGEHLGYVPRYADRECHIPNRQREQIRTALANGFVIARASKVGGFTKRDGSKASYGVVVQYYTVSALYGFHEGEKEEEADIMISRRSNTTQKQKAYSNKYKGKDAQRRLDLRNIEKESPERKKRENRARRQAFKRGEDIKSSQLGWHYSAYISEAEALELFKERRAG